MHDRNISAERFVQWTKPSVLVVVAFLLLLMASWGGPVLAQEPQPPTVPGHTPPLGDCFGDLLSEDPLHCYALEQAVDQKVIDVEKIYDADGLLYFFLRGEEPVGEEVYQFLKDRFYEFADRWWSMVPKNPWYQPCLSRGFTYRECYLDRTSWYGSYSLPKPMVHDNVLFHTGGEEARRLVRGWPSWRLVWPETAETSAFGVAASASDVSGVDLAAPAFDVSDVDVTNFPAIDCVQEPYITFCRAWEKYPGKGIAGEAVHRNIIYMQMKDDPEQIEALKAQEAERMAGKDFNGMDYELVVIPVKYDYEELWRWATILDRFAYSRGNTIGIIGAGVTANGNRQSEADVWLNGLEPRVSDTTGDYRKDDRTIIRVVAQNPRRVVDALPVLLPQLGIPLDAVGLVRYSYTGRPTLGFLDGGEVPASGLAPEAPNSGALDSMLGGFPAWIIAVGAGAATLVAVGAATAFLALRRRRRALTA